jgi:hypothetical protein
MQYSMKSHCKALRDKYLPALLIGLILSFSATAQVDTTKTLQPVNGNGFQYKTIKQDSAALFPADTFKLKNIWNGIAFKNGVPYFKGGGTNVWAPFGTGGSGGTVNITPLDSLRIDSIIKRSALAGFGDSFTAGFTDLVGGYPERLSNLSGRIMVNNGIGGATSQVIRDNFLAHPEQWLNSTIIWSGYNNRDQGPQIKSDVKRMVDSLLAHGNTRFLILTIPNGPADSAVGGTHYMWYDSIKSVQTYFTALYPGHVVDVRTFLVSKYDPALPNDVLAHSQDQIPPSLRTEAYPNGVHLTKTGYFYVAKLIDSAYGRILYDTSFSSRVIDGNYAVHLLSGLMPNINVRDQGGIYIGNKRIAFRPNRYTAPDNIFFSDGGGAVTTASKNTAIGIGSMLSQVSGSENTMGGYNSGKLFTNTNFNTGFGSSVMTNATAGANNTAVGYQNMLGSDVGNRNTSIGSTSQRSAAGGTDNSTIGEGSLAGNTLGSNNTVAGRASGANGTNVNRLSILGANSCTQCVVGDNSGVGYQSLFSTTNGFGNSGIGEYSLYSNLLGNWNTAVGQYSLWGTNAGTASHYQNTAVGAYSLYQITAAANRNIGIGYKSIFSSLTGSNNTAIGDSIDLDDNTASNQLNIMNSIYGKNLDGQGSTVTANPNIGIGIKSPNTSSILDLTSTAKGFLVPRMTTTQQNAISSPATGLLIFNTDSLKHSYYNGTGWIYYGSGTGGGGGGGVTSVSAGLGMGFTTITTSGAVAVDTTIGTGVVMWPRLNKRTDSLISILSAGSLTVNSTSVGSGTAQRVLYESATNKVSETSGFTFNTTVLSIPAAGKYQIGTASALFIPDQTNFLNTISVGNSLASLSHSSGVQGQYNTYVGIVAGNANTSGANNTGVGARTLQANTSGTDNTGMGDASLFSNTTGINNVAMGRGALQANVSGNSSVAIGYNSFTTNTASQNSGFGSNAGNSNSSGADNTYGGFQAGYQNATGSNNTAFGSGSLTGTGGNNFSGNSTYGYFTLHNNTTGSNNTAVGQNALLNNTTGGSNTALGNTAGQGVTTGSSVLALGDGINGFKAAELGTIAIGTQGLRRFWVNGNGKMILGNSITNTDTTYRGADVTVNGTFKIENVPACTTCTLDSVPILENGIITKVDMSSGTWTPTITANANLASSTNATGKYTRHGNIVSFTIYVNITPTAGSAAVLFDASLPIASNFTAQLDALGTGTVIFAGSNEVAQVYANSTNDRFAINTGTVSSTSARDIIITGQYEIK